MNYDTHTYDDLITQLAFWHQILRDNSMYLRTLVDKEITTNKLVYELADTNAKVYNCLNEISEIIEELQNRKNNKRITK
jgi:hypothetical protein